MSQLQPKILKLFKKILSGKNIPLSEKMSLSNRMSNPLTFRFWKRLMGEK